jgi:RNA polymerase sigma-70 factor (family 1)
LENFDKFTIQNQTAFKIPVPQDDTYNEKELFRRIANGDELAFAEIFHLYKSPLFDYGIKITKSQAAAEELVQECFLKLWLSRLNLPSIENPVGYLHMMARNAGVDYLRRLSLDAALHQKVWAGISVTENPTLQKVQVSETQKLIDEAVAQLPAQQREVFRLSRYEGLNYEQIGLQMGIAGNTVKNHLVKALKFVREYLVNKYGGPVVMVIMAFPGSFLIK